jgi:hypothetical protein
MGITEKFRSTYHIWRGTNEPVRAIAQPTPTTTPSQNNGYLPSLGGSVVAATQSGLLVRENAPFTITPSRTANRLRFFNDADSAFKHLSVDELAEVMCDISPEISSALWYYLRFGNPGAEDDQPLLKVLRSKNSKAAYGVGQNVIDEWVRLIQSYQGNGTFATVVNRMLFSQFVRGSVAVELVLAEDLTTAVDLVVIDPVTIQWMKEKHPVRGAIDVPFQMQNGKKVRLDIPTFFYCPVDPAPGSPFGRAILAPAIFSAVFLISLLQDIKRVVRQQGWARIHAKINLEEMLKIVPASDQQDGAKLKALLDTMTKEAITAFQALKPDDTFVSSSMIELDQVGGVNAQSLGAVDAVIEAVERIVTRALKSTPLLMGTHSSGSNQSSSSREFEIYIASIDSQQKSVEAILQNAGNLVLRAGGVSGVVDCTFPKLRSSERAKDAMSLRAEMENEMFKYNAGWITHAEACENATGNKNPASDAPIAPIEPPSAGYASDINPEPAGSNRSSGEWPKELDM